MAFNRTPAGLSNLYLFLKVDHVVFVEGGKDIPMPNIFSESYQNESIDAKFWENIFKVFTSHKLLYFRSLGSKTHLTDIYNHIIDNAVKNCSVAMDRDHENLKNSKGLYYTFGYSWENDVWGKDVLMAVLQAICLNCNLKALHADCNNLYAKFKKNIKPAVELDKYIALKKLKTGFPELRKVGLLMKSPSHNSEPQLDIDKIKEIMKDAKKKNKIAGKIKVKCNVKKDCYGHLFSYFNIRIFKFLKVKYSKDSTCSDNFLKFLVIEKFFTGGFFKNNSNIFKHYKKLFSLNPI